MLAIIINRKIKYFLYLDKRYFWYFDIKDKNWLFLNWIFLCAWFQNVNDLGKVDILRFSVRFMPQGYFGFKFLSTIKIPQQVKKSLNIESKAWVQVLPLL